MLGEKGGECGGDLAGLFDVHEVRKGRIADFEGFRLDRAQRRAIPYYVDATFENRGRVALSRSLLRASLEDSDGREYRPTTLVVLGGSFRRCPQPARSVLKPGRSFDGCSVVLLPKDASPGRVRFQGDVAKDPLYWETRRLTAHAAAVRLSRRSVRVSRTSSPAASTSAPAAAPNVSTSVAPSASPARPASR